MKSSAAWGERLWSYANEDSGGEPIDVDAISADSSEHATEFDAMDVSRPTVFEYEVEFDAAGPLVTFDDYATLHGRFRHMAEADVELQPGVQGAFNLGVRIFKPGTEQVLFEDRMVPERRSIPPHVWVGVDLRIPRIIISFSDEFSMHVEMLKEREYWFTEFGSASIVRQVSFKDGLPLAFGSAIDEQKSPTRLDSAPTQAQDSKPSATIHLVFDVSDLIQYFHNARLPTGIQRVQIEVITSMIFSLSEDYTLKIACFTKQTDTWVELPPLFFNHICKLALVDGDPLAPEWLRVLEELKVTVSTAKRLVFARGAYLINLGTSWWLQNYFLHVRAAKAQFGIRYVPYVHDCIPIMTPEHCVDQLTRDFITWALGAFQHADHIMVNSRATAADVKLVAGRLGHEIEEPSIVTLDADYRAANARLPQEFSQAVTADIFLKHDIVPNDYVLFVSTIESRKNHLMAFSVWLALAKKHGEQNVPKLVCVGNRGWLNDAIFSKISASKILQRRIKLLSRISDPELEMLYRNCRFTIYPSSYEGWGLPVTESLCFGKVPVLARGSSLPEAGGDFGEYFDLGSESELLALLERMMFDDAYRQSRERNIATYFRARTWTEIADQVVNIIRGWASTDLSVQAGRKVFADLGLWPFPVEPGRYYALIENEYTHIWSGMVAGEMFRQGDGWWWTEPWGCWTKAGKVARMAFLAPVESEEAVIIYVGIRGVQGHAATATVTLAGVGRRAVRLQPEELKWLVFRVDEEALAILPRSIAGVLFEFHFAGDQFADFRESTDGQDHRLASIGVCGFMSCAASDTEARLSFVESVSLGDLSGLTQLEY